MFDLKRIIPLTRRGCAILFTILTLAACHKTKSQDAPQGGEVVIYTALDQIFSEPILKRFEAQSGIKVRPVYDSEAAKTTGLVSRLAAERERPRCDVFWNNEITRTIALKKQGLLAAYVSPNAAQIPARFKDPEGYWTGLAARARVLAYNTTMVKPGDVPRTLKELADPKWKGKVGMAYPLFGSTATHAAVIYNKWGREAALGLFKGLAANGVKVLEGNMTSCRAVASGELPLGLTDSDDANVLRSAGKPIDWVLIEDGKEPGALLFPNTVALVKGAPHPEAARRLIDFILSPDVEAVLAASESAQIPLHPGVKAPEVVQKMSRAKFIDPEFEKASAMLQTGADDLKVVFGRQ